MPVPVIVDVSVFGMRERTQEGGNLRDWSDGLQVSFWHDSAEDRKVGDLQTKLGSVLSPLVSAAALVMHVCWEGLDWRVSFVLRGLQRMGGNRKR